MPWSSARALRAIAIVSLLLAGLQLASFGCSSKEEDPGTEGPRPGETETMVPAAEGGRVVSSDGRAVLTIPPGALDVDTKITVRELARTAETVSSVYDFGPDGLAFKVPAQLEITLDAEAVAKAPKLGMTHGQGFTILPSSIQASVLGGGVAHFTGFSAVIDPGAPPPPPAPVTAIVSGTAHTCFIVSPGTVRCWGANGDGQTGIGGHARVPAPVDVPGIADAVQLAAGDRHTCALTKTGAVKCWGSNNHNQLGLENLPDGGAAAPTDTPRDVPGLASGVVAISAVADTTCAIMASGSERCWGVKLMHEFWASISPAPGSLFREQRPFGFTAAGFSMSTWNQCVVGTSGTLACTPMTPGGAFPPAPPATGPVLQPVAGVSNVAEVAMTTGLYTGQFPSDVIRRSQDQTAVCARLTDGTVTCWSRGNDVGGGDTPTQVKMTTGMVLTGVTQLAAGEKHACAIFGPTRQVACWGANTYSQLGGQGGATTAGVVAGLTGVSSITAGGQHTCAAVGADVYCWGDNSIDQLGGKPHRSDTPENVVGITDAVELHSSTYLTCARTTTGAAKCWPFPATGLVTPATISGLATGVSAVGIGTNTYCAVVSGAVRCWGYSITGVISGYNPVPVAIPELATGVIGVTGATNAACALLGTGSVQCWGDNRSGQLGTGNVPGQYLRPTTVVGLAGATAVSGDDGNVRCAMTSAGGVKCWGLDWLLGNGAPTTATTFTDSAVDVGGLTSGVQALDVGSDRLCVIMSSGALKCWGRTTTLFGGYVNVPTDVPGFGSGVAYVSSGGGGTCAVMNTGTLHCTQGAGISVVQPNASGLVQIPGITNAASVSIGSDIVCVRLKTGAVQCWGANGRGQLGNGRVPITSAPIKIPLP